MSKLLSSVLLGLLLAPLGAGAQELLEDRVFVVKARVLQVEHTTRQMVPGTSVEQVVQTLRAEVLEGAGAGEIVVFDNDYVELKEGERFYLRVVEDPFSDSRMYSVAEPYRLPALGLLVALFIVLAVAFGGLQGLRGLASLAGSLILIIYVLLPGILKGYSPILVSIAVSALIIVVGSYITHGFNRTTSAAVFGMISTVVLTGLLAYASVHYTALSGYSSEEVAYLNFSTQGSINIVGLLLGGIMIGLLGVLYDVAIGQAISVEELNRVAPHLPRRTIYARAVRIGREHIGALVNTLAIAYVGVSLPLLLLFYTSSTESVGVMINSELFATEIVRTMIGSIGLVLAVPITTLIAVYMLMRHVPPVSPEVRRQELENLEHIGHAH